MPNKFKLTLASFVMMSLTACGGGGSGSTESTETLSLSGIAIDGYLGQATVCIDINRNSACDLDEPNAISEADGTYTIRGLTQQQIDNFPVVVEALANTTIDSDLDNSVIPNSYNLVSPAGQGQVISPLTTILYNKMKEGFSLDEAKSLIALKLSSNDAFDSFVNLITADFVDQNTDEAKKSHLVAQTLARVIAKTFVELDMDQLDEAHSALVQEAIMEAVTMSLPAIVSAINTGNYNNLGLIDNLAEEEATRLVRDRQLSSALDVIINLQNSKREFRERFSILTGMDIISLIDNGDDLMLVKFENSNGSNYPVFEVNKFGLLADFAGGQTGNNYRRECVLDVDDPSVSPVRLGLVDFENCLFSSMTQDDVKVSEYNVRDNSIDFKLANTDEIEQIVSRVQKYDLSGLQIELGALDPKQESFPDTDYEKKVNFTTGAYRIDYVLEYKKNSKNISNENISYDTMCGGQIAFTECKKTYDGSLVSYVAGLPTESTKWHHNDDNDIEYLKWFSGDKKLLFYCKDNGEADCVDGSLRQIDSLYEQTAHYVAYRDLGDWLDGRLLREYYLENALSVFRVQPSWYLADYAEINRQFNEQAIKDMWDQGVFPQEKK